MSMPSRSRPGEDFVQRRTSLVQSQIAPHGIRDERVLSALRQVPREEFVAADLRSQAYDNAPLPIGFDQTISQPFTVAFMVAALQLTGSEKVLEVGTGCGYGAAILSHLAREVHTIERIPQLAREARQRLHRLGYTNIHVHEGDGTLGLPAEAPLDAICVTAAAELLPPAYEEQLAEGGRIIIPIGDMDYGQEMTRFTKTGGKLRVEKLGQFAFVPLVGKFGWQRAPADSSSDALELK